MIKSDGVNEVTLQLLEKGFFQTADRAQFLRSLQKHAPAQSLSTELLVLKAFGKVQLILLFGWMNSVIIEEMIH